MVFLVRKISKSETIFRLKRIKSGCCDALPLVIKAGGYHASTESEMLPIITVLYIRKSRLFMVNYSIDIETCIPIAIFYSNIFLFLAYWYFLLNVVGG